MEILKSISTDLCENILYFVNVQYYQRKWVCAICGFESHPKLCDMLLCVSDSHVLSYLLFSFTFLLLTATFSGFILCSVCCKQQTEIKKLKEWEIR